MPLQTVIRSFSTYFTRRNTRHLSSGLSSFLKERNFLLKHSTQYDKAYREFRWPQVNQFNWGLDYFDSMAKNNHKTALWLVTENGEQKVSFDEMSRRSNQVANFLVSRGVKPFDRILLILPNMIQLWECTLAAIKIPAIIIPTSTLLTAEEIAYRLKEGKIQHVITSMADINKFSLESSSINGIVVDGDAPDWHGYKESHYHAEEYQALIKSKASDPLLQYFTSGTTSKPKLVTHTHQSYPIGHLSTMYWLGTNEQSVHLNISTAGWGKHAWSSFFAPWNSESTVMSYGYDRFDIDKLLDMLVHYPITSLCAPPTVWRLLRQKPLQDYKILLKQGLSAGEPLNPEVIADIKKAWGFTIREGYGQTETTALIGYCLNQEIIPGTMGHPLPGYQLKLVDEAGKETDEGELGIVRDPNPVGLMQGYSDAAKTTQVMRGGLYRTGDVLKQDKTSFFFVGRADDVFKANGGYRISPFELESILIEHPAIQEAAVVPKPDAIKGMIPKAFIVLRPGYENSATLKNELILFLKKRLAPSHMIHELETCHELPKTSSGKIRRVELKGREAVADNRGMQPH